MNIKKPVKKGVAKTPVVMQLEALECGAASLAMILAYYDKWIPLEQVRSDCGVSRDGSNAKNCMKAARSYGLIAKGYRYEPEALKEEGTFPCIIHWNFNHFVVLNGFKGNYAYINDPGRGEVKVSMKDFDEAFTGICLCFEPGPDFEPSGKPKSVLKFASERLKGAGIAIIFAILTSIIASLLGVIQPGFSRVFFDRLLTHKNSEWLLPFIAGLSLISLIQIVIAWIQLVYNNRINGKLAVVGSTSFMWKILKMPMEFFTQRMSGDILSRQNSNSTIANTLVNTFAPLLLNSIMMILYFVVMIRYNVVLTFVGLASLLINALVSSIISKKRINVSRVATRDQGKLIGTTVSGIEMIETIKASGAENGFFDKWAGYQASVNNGEVAFSKINSYIGLIPTIVSSLASLTITGIGIYLTFKGQFTIGMISAFQGYLASFTAPASTLISAGQTIQEMRTEMERIEDVMKYPDDPMMNVPDYSDETTFDKLSGVVELKNVTFGYSKLDEPLIKDFNLSIKPGQRIALVGSSGCGKSTISKLISGLNKPWSGEILFDGKSIDEIDRSVFTGSLAVVDQDIILFEDTIKNNI
ncbi:MAG: cysteine peptidase family C39 domain-containing protein, partial [Erysipelotrichaceae bacterium]|nr:cysteine peptidase family C39 domain-containing protein [Erysipelotrichaceae bacterium]